MRLTAPACPPIEIEEVLVIAFESDTVIGVAPCLEALYDKLLLDIDRATLNDWGEVEKVSNPRE